MAERADGMSRIPWSTLKQHGVASLVAAFVAIWSGSTQHLYAQDCIDGFDPLEYSYAADSVMKYRVFVPETYDHSPDGSDEYPLVLFLHGWWGSGAWNGLGYDNIRQLTDAGCPSRNLKDMNCIIVAPQHNNAPENNGWGGWDDRQVELAQATVEQVVDSLRIDSLRRYVTGLSQGGYGTLNITRLFPGYYAAAGPVCAWMPVNGCDNWIAAWSDIPMWLYHGSLDETIPYHNSRDLYACLSAAHLANDLSTAQVDSVLRFTTVPNGQHADAWLTAYWDADFLEWLLAQRLGSFPAPTSTRLAHTPLGQPTDRPLLRIAHVLGQRYVAFRSLADRTSSLKIYGTNGTLIRATSLLPSATCQWRAGSAGVYLVVQSVGQRISSYRICLR